MVNFLQKEGDSASGGMIILMFLPLVQNLILLLLFLLLLTVFATPVSAVDFSANWGYRQTGGDERDTQSDFRQSYRLGLGTGLNYKPSHAISANGSVSYSQSRSGNESTLSESDNLTPALRFSLINDIFISQLSGSITHSKKGSGTHSNHSSWEFSLNSAWDIPFWPRLGFNYSEQNESGDLDDYTFFYDATRTNKTKNFTYDWDLALAQLYYSYTNVTNEDRINEIVSDSNYHFARFETGGKFWNNRFGFNLAQQFTKGSQEIKSLGGSDFDVPLSDGAITAAVTDKGDELFKSGNVLLDKTLGPNNPLTINNGERAHLSMRFFERKQIDTLKVRHDFSTSGADVNSLKWDLYIQSNEPPDSLAPLGTTVWKIEQTDIPFTYDSSENQIVMTINTQFEGAVMVVAVNETSATLVFTQLMAFSRFTDVSNTESSGYITNFNSSYRISRTLNAFFNLKLDHSTAEFGEGDIDYDRQTLGGSLSWTPLPSIRPSLSYSETLEEGSNSPEERSTTYSFNVSTTPLPEANVSFNYTNNERYVDDRKNYSSNRYSLVSRAPIYPDLTASWLLSFADTEVTVIDDDLVLANNIFNSRLELNAQLTQDLASDFVTSYRRSKDDNDKTQSSDVLLGLRYRPSDLLSMRGSYSTFFGDFDKDDIYNLAMNLRLLHTNKARLLFSANRNKAKNTIDTFALDGNWDISRRLFMRSGASYRMGELNSYFFQINLTLSL